MNTGVPKNLIYSSDDDPGFTRRKCGKAYAYYDDERNLISCPETKQRLKSLAIPPAYQKVWYCSLPNGHLQATGRDSRGRKQYRYHQIFRNYREQKKFGQMAAFGDALPRIRRTVTRLSNEASVGDVEYVLALVIELLDETGLRIGSESYLRENKTRGLVTLTCRNLKPDKNKRGITHLSFVGKGGKQIDHTLARKRLSARVRKLEDLPGQRLFRYASGSDEYRDLTSDQVNQFIAGITGHTFTAKDFRTWVGTRAAAFDLSHTQETNTRKAIKSAVEYAAQTLGNTPTIARKSYIHPEILSEEGIRYFQALNVREGMQGRSRSGLSSFETSLMEFLEPPSAVAV